MNLQCMRVVDWPPESLSLPLLYRMSTPDSHDYIPDIHDYIPDIHDCTS